MQTIRKYLCTSIKKIFLILASAIIFYSSFVAIDWLLPGRLHNGLVITDLSFASEMALLLGSGIFFLFGYKAIKFFNSEKSPQQEFVKMMPAAIIFVSTALLALNFFAGRDITDCEKFDYNEKLNGGLKEFNGKRYTINICGSGVSQSHFFGDGMDTVQLTIIDEKGHKLATRDYKVSWDTELGHEPLITKKDSIIYQDDENQRSYIINMPPTLIDWIQVRIPLFRVGG